MPPRLAELEQLHIQGRRKQISVGLGARSVPDFLRGAVHVLWGIAGLQHPSSGDKCWVALCASQKLLLALSSHAQVTESSICNMIVVQPITPISS